MLETPDIEQVLSKAKEQQRQYNWSGALDSYKKALGLASEQDLARRAEIHEQSGYALYKLAMQAENVDSFKERMGPATTNYAKARDLYEKLNEPGKGSRSGAMIAYLSFWLASEPAEKKRFLDDSWRLTKESCKVFGEHKDANGYAETYSQLHIAGIFRLLLEGDFHRSEQTLRDAVEHGEQAIRLLSISENPGELARALAITAVFANWFSTCLPDPEEQQKYVEKVLAYWNKAKDLSEEAALLQLSQSPVGAFILPTGSDETLTNLKKALEQAGKTGDRLVTGSALDQLAHHTGWKAVGTENPDLLREALQYAEEAKNQYSPLSFISPRGDKFWIEAPAEYYWQLALFETDAGKRRDLLEKSLGPATDGLKLAEQSGYPEVIGLAHHVLSKTLASLANLEARSGERKRLLGTALEHRKDSIKITEQLQPFLYWNQGVMQNYLGDIKSQLAEVTEDPEARRSIFEETLQDKESSLRLCTRNLSILSLSQFGHLGRWQYQYGDFLNRSYEVTKDKQQLRKAAQAFLDAAESYQRLNLKSRAAECCWKAAEAYDTLDEHLKSAENFTLATNNYTNATQEIPQLREFYRQHASYMEAWGEIEKARFHHARQEYASAKEYYEKAATLHGSTERWKYLSHNYSAWGQVEKAEDLSRNAQEEEAIQAFGVAAELFQQAKASLQAGLKEIEDPGEKGMAIGLLKAADLRREYCRARVLVEEARLLDKKGDHSSSSETYGRATQTLRKITEALESEQDRKEIELIITLCRAWQMMTLAEAKTSPELYLEASRLFEEAKELSPDERGRMLALGHSRFCQALEAGARFVDKRDAKLHATAVENLESAADYYLRAGFQNASEYAEATELLFDAYLRMNDAKKEKDPENKAKLYAMAERVLEASAESYLKAEHPGKRKQVSRLLEKVKKERELALSLSEVVYRPPILSTTVAFSTPTPTHERPVGLDRFEHAAIQASVISRRKSLMVGEELDLEIELVNAGRGPAQLIKIEDILPQGFELIEKPEAYRVEDDFVNMKGKRLDPLKTEEIKLVLKPKLPGQFRLKPRILFLDESGGYKSHEPEPLEITVKELGISGWIKGR